MTRGASDVRKAALARARAERLAFQNWTAPIGTAVEVTKDDDSVLRTVTESMPWLVGAGTPIIKVKGIVGGYQLTRVRVLPPPGEDIGPLFASPAQPAKEG